MKRRREQERDDAIAREQADARREALLAELKSHEAAGREPESPPVEPVPEDASDEDQNESAASPTDDVTDAEQGSTGESKTA